MWRWPSAVKVLFIEQADCSFGKQAFGFVGQAFQPAIK
jgi:hypothetical protein